MKATVCARLFAIAIVAAGCAHGGLAGSGGPAAAPDQHAAPTLTLDGKDVNIGQGASTTLNQCKENPSPKVDRTITWQGQGGGAYVAELALGVFNLGGQKKPMLQIQLPNGDKYDTNMKFTNIAISGPTDGVYRFSGTVHKDVPATSDETLKAVKVEGSVTCTNYNSGTVAGCKYASAAEISAATGLSLDQPEDNGLRGCQYNQTGTLSFARLEYFPTAGWDEYVNNDAQRYGESIEDVPELGDRAKRIGLAIYVRTTAERSFGVFVQHAANSAPDADTIGPSDAEIAIAKLVEPRIEADSH
jgi:hypothetical protein